MSFWKTLFKVKGSPTADDFLKAAGQGELIKVWALLTVHHDLVLKSDESGGTALHEAAHKGHGNVVKLLLANKADVSAKTSYGWTPLHNAACYDHKEVVALLLAKRAEVNAKNNDGDTPLHKAASGGRSGVVELLLAKGAEVNAKNNDGDTPLHKAWAKAVAELLLASKAEAGAGNKYGQTPLHCAAAGGSKDVVELLLANKVEVNAKDRYGQTPLNHAVAGGHTDVAELLLANSAELNVKGHLELLQRAAIETQKVHEWYRDESGQSQVAEPVGEHVGPDHCGEIFSAVKCGDSDRVKALLTEHPAVLYSREPGRGWTPLQIAAAHGHAEVAALLLYRLPGKGIPNQFPVYARDWILSIANAKDDRDEALCIAAVNGHPDVVALLLLSGADIDKEERISGTPLDRALYRLRSSSGGEAARYRLVARLLS